MGAERSDPPDALVDLRDGSASEDTFRQLLDAAPDAVLVTDQAGRIVLVNAQCERLFGYGRADLLGREVELLIPERFRGAHVGHRTRFVQSPKVRPMGSGLALSARRRDGSEFPIEVSISPLQTPSGTLISASIRDITELRERQDELRRAYDAAAAANSAKSEFLASMSHELRTPLNAILGFAQLLQRDKREPLSERHRERVEHVIKGGQHLLHLIDEILDLARIEAGRIPVSLEPVEVGAALLEVKATLDPMASRAGIELLVAAVPAGLPHVRADRTRFKQVLMNYGSNAIKYGRRGGRASFETSHAGDRVRVTLTDDGVGIPADKQAQVFQPFQRAGQETGPIEGTGIGLAITKRLTELMEGSVGFRSVEGEGSTFWIELPAHAAPSAVPGAPRVESVTRGAGLAGHEGPRYSIVYVEDNPSSIALLRDLLADFERVELLTAPTAEIGLELVRAKRPHAVIMDIHLPGMSGIEAAQRLRGWPETRDIPVIALSAAAMVRDSEKVRGAGFHRYLTKPVKIDELAGVLEELLKG